MASRQRWSMAEHVGTVVVMLLAVTPAAFTLTALLRRDDVRWAVPVLGALFTIIGTRAVVAWARKEWAMAALTLAALSPATAAWGVGGPVVALAMAVFAGREAYRARAGLGPGA